MLWGARPIHAASAPGGSRTPNLLIRSQVRLNGVRSSVSAGRVPALCAELSPVLLRARPESGSRQELGLVGAGRNALGGESDVPDPQAFGGGLHVGPIRRLHTDIHRPVLAPVRVPRPDLAG
jgi:hypothetical protein